MVIPCNFPDSSTCANTVRGPVTNPTQRPSSPCDVNFIVGPEGDTWTIPGRRDAIMTNCEALAILLRGAEMTIRIADVNKQGFEYLLRHIEGTEIQFTSIQTGRTTLDVAYKYQCVSLVKICIKYLDLNLDAKNVLTVYKDLAKYCNNAHRLEPCAPEYHVLTPSPLVTTVTNMCSALMHNCLLLIDANANEVLTQDLETLDFRDMSTIIQRESLQINDELILFNGIMRWLRCECMRISKPVNAITRKELLGDLIYKVRFGLMSRHEFMNGPSKTGVFTPNEINEILVVIDHPTNLGDHPLLRNANVKRVKDNVEPKYLSSRTEPHINNNSNVKNKKKKNKKEKSKALLNCLTVWTVLFD